MEQSILVSTKGALGVDKTFTAYDDELLMHINAAFSTLTQLGVGPEAGFQVTDETTEWSALGLTIVLLGSVKNFIFLSTKIAFDPPATSFHTEAIKSQLSEMTSRIQGQVEFEGAQT